MDQSPALVQYVDELIHEKHQVEMEDEDKGVMRDEIMSRLNRFILTRTLEELVDKSPADFDTLENMLNEKASDDDIQRFISTKVPNGDTFLTNVLLDFRDIYLEP